jgi:hypothetical protein
MTEAMEWAVNVPKYALTYQNTVIISAFMHSEICLRYAFILNSLWLDLSTIFKLWISNACFIVTLCLEYRNWCLCWYLSTHKKPWTLHLKTEMKAPSVGNRQENVSYWQPLSLVNLARFFILVFLYKVMIIYIGFKVLISVTMKSTVLWVVMLCIFEKAQYFGGTHYLHLSGQPTRWRWYIPPKCQAVSELHGVATSAFHRWLKISHKAVSWNCN